MDKQIIRLTESDLHNIVRNSVNRILKEGDDEQKLSMEGTFINVDEVREDFMQEVYRVLDADPTNDRANQIIDAFDNLPTITIQKPTDKVEPRFREIKNLNIENYIHNIVKESVNRILSEGIDPWEDAVYKHHTRERLPKGWERIDREDDEPIYRDPDFNEYVKDEYGNFRRIENDLDF